MHLDLRYSVDTSSHYSLQHCARAFAHILPDESILLLVCNGSASAFELNYQPVIDLVNNAFTEKFKACAENIMTRLKMASKYVEEELYRLFPSDHDSEHASYRATFLAVGIQSEIAAVVWIGPFEALHYQNANVIHRSEPHVVACLNPRVVATTRMLDSSIGNECQIERELECSGPWNMSAGDVLVLSEYALVSLSGDSEILRTVLDNPQSPAAALTAWAQRRTGEYGYAAIVARAE